MVDEKALAGIVQIIGLAELLVGSNIVPGLKKFFEDKFQMTEAEKGELAVGLDELFAAKARITARRAEIAKEIRK